MMNLPYLTVVDCIWFESLKHRDSYGFNVLECSFSMFEWGIEVWNIMNGFRIFGE